MEREARGDGLSVVVELPGVQSFDARHGDACAGMFGFSNLESHYSVLEGHLTTGSYRNRTRSIGRCAKLAR